MGLGKRCLGKSPWKALPVVTIPTSGTVDVDTIDVGEVCAIKYVICLQGDGKTQSSEFFVSAKGADFVDTKYATLGDSLAVSVNFLKVGSDGVLRLVNSEAFAVTATVIRLLVG